MAIENKVGLRAEALPSLELAELSFSPVGFWEEMVVPAAVVAVFKFYLALKLLEFLNV